MPGPFCKMVVSNKWQNRNEIQERDIKYGIGVKHESNRDQGLFRT